VAAPVGAAARGRGWQRTPECRYPGPTSRPPAPPSPPGPLARRPASGGTPRRGPARWLPTPVRPRAGTPLGPPGRAPSGGPPGAADRPTSGDTAAPAGPPHARQGTPGPRRARQPRCRPRRRPHSPRALARRPRPTPTRRTGRGGHTARGTGGADAAWPPETGGAGVVVVGPLGVGGARAPAPPLTAAQDAVEAGTLPSDAVLWSAASPLRCAPPTAPAASPRIASLQASTRTAAGGGPATAGDLPGGPDRCPSLPLPRRRGVPRGRLSRVFTPPLACAIAATLGAPGSPARGAPIDAAGFPAWDGLRVGASSAEGDAASPHQLTPGHREPATRLSGDDRDRTCTGQWSVPFRAHQRLVSSHTSCQLHSFACGHLSLRASALNGSCTQEATSTSGKNASPTPSLMKKALNPNRCVPTSRYPFSRPSLHIAANEAPR
jgi:hypothetical protein